MVTVKLTVVARTVGMNKRRPLTRAMEIAKMTKTLKMKMMVKTMRMMRMVGGDAGYCAWPCSDVTVVMMMHLRGGSIMQAAHLAVTIYTVLTVPPTTVVHIPATTVLTIPATTVFTILPTTDLTIAATTTIHVIHHHRPRPDKQHHITSSHNLINVPIPATTTGHLTVPILRNTIMHTATSNTAGHVTVAVATTTTLSNPAPLLLRLIPTIKRNT